MPEIRHAKVCEHVFTGGAEAQRDIILKRNSPPSFNR